MVVACNPLCRFAQYDCNKQTVPNLTGKRSGGVLCGPYCFHNLASGKQVDSAYKQLTCADIMEACCTPVYAAWCDCCWQMGDDGLSTWKATVSSLFPMPGVAPSPAMLSAYGFFDGTTGTSTLAPSSGGSGSNVQQRLEPPHPVKYSAFGAAVSEVELDVLTGERRVLSSHILYDCGSSLNPGIDMGQIEGAFVMGLGVMLSEEVVFNESSGQLLSGSTWSYKIPTPDLIPQRFTVSFLHNAPNPKGILSSKASGEPALMTSTSALLALQQAVAAAASELQQLVGAKASAVGSGVGAVGGVDAVVSDTGGAGTGTNGAVSRGWSVLAAPATPQRLKSVVGSFSIADLLEATMSC